MISTSRLWSKAIPALVCVLSLVSFETMCIIENSRTGPTHADDAYYANISKNLATGVGYATLIQTDGDVYRLVPFDPAGTLGPIPILLTAALISGLGNVPWAPGLSNILLQFSMLLLAFIILYRKHPGSAALFSFLFLLMVVSTGRWHFELWYSMLGEGTVVASMVLLTSILWCRDDVDTPSFSSWTLYGVGMLCGIAVSTKLLALLSVAPALVFVGPFQEHGTRRKLEAILVLAAGFLSPLIVFEIYKLSALGPAKYIENTRELIAFIAAPSQNSALNVGIVDKFSSRSADLHQHFGVRGSLLIALGATGVCLLVQSGRVLLAKVLGTSLLACWTWWFFVSPQGWPRYAYYGVSLVFLSLAFGAISTKPFGKPLTKQVPRIAALTAILGIVALASFKLGFLPGIMAARGLDLKPSEKLAQAIEATRVLEDRGFTCPMYTQWWATAVGIEYLLRGTGHFTTIRDPRFNDAVDAVIVLDLSLISKSDQALVKLLEERCSGRIFEGSNFLVASCTNP